MKVFWEIIKTSFKVLIQYKWTFAVTLLSQPILVIINYTLFKSIYTYNEASTIKGYELPQMVWFFTGIMIINCFVWNSTVQDMSQKIISGDLTEDLLRPISIIKGELAFCFASRAIAMMMDLLPGMVIYSIIIYPTFLSPLSLLRFIAVAIPAFFLSFLCSFLLGLLAMSIKSNTSLMAISSLLIAFAGGTLIPMEFYPQWLVNFTNFLPYKYIYYWPIQFFLNKSPANQVHTMFQVLAIQLVWIIALYLLYKVLWKQMIKKFCAVGG